MRKGRIKSNKEYAVRINHPEYGVLYLYSINSYYSNNFAFSKSMKRKIIKWKTEYGVKNFINDMLYLIKRDISCTISLELEYSKSHKNKIKLLNKNITNQIFSVSDYDKAKNKVKDQKNNITNTKNEIEKFFTHQKDELIENIKIHSIENNFIEKLKHLIKKVTDFKGLTVSKITDKPIIIDYVDASFNFRKLKINFLHTEYDET